MLPNLSALATQLARAVRPVGMMVASSSDEDDDDDDDDGNEDDRGVVYKPQSGPAPPMPAQDADPEEWKLYILEHTATKLEDAPLSFRNNKEYMRLVVTFRPDQIGDIGNLLLEDKSFMKEAMEPSPLTEANTGLFAMHASPALRDNEQFMRFALNKAVRSVVIMSPAEAAALYGSASDRLRQLPTFVASAIRILRRNRGVVLSPSQRVDGPFLLNVFRNINQFKITADIGIDAQLLNDPEFMFEMLKIDLTLFRTFLTPQLRQNEEFVLRVLKAESEYIRFVDPTLRADADFLIRSLGVVKGDDHNPHELDAILAWMRATHGFTMRNDELMGRAAAESFLFVQLYLKRIKTTPTALTNLLIKKTLERDPRRIYQWFRAAFDVSLDLTARLILGEALKTHGAALDDALAKDRNDWELQKAAAESSPTYAFIVLHELHQQKSEYKPQLHSEAAKADFDRKTADTATAAAKAAATPGLAQPIKNAIEGLAQDLVAPLYASADAAGFEQDMNDTYESAAKRQRTEAARKMAADVHAAHVRGVCRSEFCRLP